jgi:hypothetical protein
MMTATNPFAAAFDAYWDWPVIGPIFTADGTDLPQLDVFAKAFPDASNIRLCRFGAELVFEAPTLGPLGATVCLKLKSETFTTWMGGPAVCLDIQRHVLPHPVWCGLATSTVGESRELMVPLLVLTQGSPITLEELDKYRLKSVY